MSMIDILILKLVQIAYLDFSQDHIRRRKNVENGFRKSSRKRSVRH